MIRRWVVLALVFTGMLISYVDRGNLSIAAVAIMNEFQLSTAAMGTLLSCFFWTYGAAQIPAGAIIDRYGIRWVYAGAFLIWSIAAAATALSRGFADVLLLRLLLGAAEAVGPLCSLAFIRTAFAPKEQGLPTSIYVAGLLSGPAVGALIGSILLERFGWRPMFALTGLGGLLWLLPWILLAPAGTSRTPGAVAVDAAPVPWRSALSTRGFWLLPACAYLFSYYWYFLLTWVPSYLMLTHRFTTLEMGRVMSIPFFATAALSIIFGAIADRQIARSGAVHALRVRFAAVGFIGGSSLLLLLVAPDRSWVLPILCVSACAVGIGSASFWAIAQLAVPHRATGRGIGFLNTVAQVAGATAPIITGWLIGPSADFRTGLFIAGVCPLAAGCCMFLTGGGGLQHLRNSLEMKELPSRDRKEAVSAQRDSNRMI